ncbi:MAG TPA: protein-export chaperone SecB [Ignavibacteriaceae bacterium]|nr:protein-export chaperone SecB [Ignavibacteriaceae bacterium]
MEKAIVQNSIRLINVLFPKVNMSFDLDSKEEGRDKFNAEVNFVFNFFDENDKGYSVQFNVNVYDEHKAFLIELIAIAVFECRDVITEDFKNSHFIQVNSPAIAFPFIRSFITTVTANAGINPVILPAFNFSKDEQKD